MWPPSLSRTTFTLLGIEFTRASQVATGMLFHSSMTTLQSWQIFETLHTSTFRLRIPQRCSIGFKSGDMLGQSITFTLSLFSKAMVVLEVCLGSLSCWNTALLPSFWREGIMLCCSIPQYMLEFMFPSMKYNSNTYSTHAALDHDIPTTILDCRHDSLIFVLLSWLPPQMLEAIRIKQIILHLIRPYDLVPVIHVLC